MSSLEKTSIGNHRSGRWKAAYSLRLGGIFVLLGLCACQSGPDLSGTWTLDKDQSSHVATWSSIELRITATEDEVAIGRLFNPRRYTRHDSVSFPVNDTQVERPVEASAKWLEQPHLGVFIDGESPQQIRANWQTPGQVLDVQRLLRLQTSQGEATVEILRQYTVSDDGARLTVTEKRSSRPDTLTYIYTRK